MTLLEIFPRLAFSSQELAALAPFIVMGLGATIALVLSALKNGRALAIGTSLVTLAIATFQWWNLSGLTMDVGNVLTLGGQTHILILALLLSGVFGILLLSGQDQRENMLPEIYPLMLFTLTGMALLVASRHLLFQFIALETMSLAIYVLVAIRRTRRESSEAAMKYFILGGLASALFLYGSALLYGSTGSFDLRMLAQQGGQPMLKTIGFMLVTAGLLFKVGAVPFHGWVPDVYQGASMPITGFMAAAVKFAAFITLTNVAGAGLADPSTKPAVSMLLAVVAALTMAYGNFTAIAQRGLKRLLAYSSIAHTGYLILGVLAGQGVAVSLYLLFYIFSAMGSFACLQMLVPGKDDATIDDLAGRGLTHPFLGAGLTIFLLGMAGIPLTAGFIGKYLVFGAGVSAGYLPLVVLGVLTSVAAVYYYLRIVVSLYMAAPNEKTIRPAYSLGAAVVMVVCVLATLHFGFRPSEIIDMFRGLWAVA